MSHTGYRPIVLLVAGLFTLAILAMAVVPGLGRAQEASPAADDAQAAELLAAGEEYYNNTCIACHQPGGTGAESEVAFTYYPPLAGNPLVTLEDPSIVVSTVLSGRGGMPSFRGASDEDLAGLITYIRQSWGNEASAVTPEFVAEVRASLDAPPSQEPTPTPGN